MSSARRGKRKLKGARSEHVVIVGAGVAGLAAGRALREAGVPVIVLEARNRIGGRIHTLYRPGLNVPVELGAEFTHGEAGEVTDLAVEHNLSTIDIAGRRFRASRDGVRVLDDFWERLDGVMRRLDEDRDPDRTFAEALARATSISSEDRALALQYVRGFHAAHPEIISERALAEGGSPRGDVRERRIGRVLHGYGSIVEALAAGLRRQIRLRSVVTSIEWRAGAVRARLANGESVKGRAAIVTVSIGVLAAPYGERGAIAFEPPLPAKRAAVDSMSMGGVSRIALRFDQPFWTSRQVAARIGDERLDTLSFLHGTSDAPFPIWWTTYPVRSPLLVGWCGGPASLALSGRSPRDLERLALQSLVELLPVTVPRLQRHLVSSHSHDWIADPFARGAYSYVRVGGDDASARLGRPVEGTLYFAGEAADPEGRTGTVHGAIATGQRAARLILETDR